MEDSTENQNPNVVDDPNTNGETSKIDDSKPNKDKTRTKLSLIYVYGFFGVIGFCFVYSLVFYCCGTTVKELKELLLTVSGVLSGPLGFVFGYYFKNGEVEK